MFKAKSRLHNNSAFFFFLTRNCYQILIRCSGRQLCRKNSALWDGYLPKTQLKRFGEEGYGSEQGKAPFRCCDVSVAHRRDPSQLGFGSSAGPAGAAGPARPAGGRRSWQARGRGAPGRPAPSTAFPRSCGGHGVCSVLCADPGGAPCHTPGGSGEPVPPRAARVGTGEGAGPGGAAEQSHRAERGTAAPRSTGACSSPLWPGATPRCCSPPRRCHGPGLTLPAGGKWRAGGGAAFTAVPRRSVTSTNSHLGTPQWCSD